MRKILLIAIVASILMTGCGSGVTKEQYDAVVAERDELQSELDGIQGLYEAKIKIAEYRKEIECQYEHMDFVLFIVERTTDTDQSEVKNSIKSAHDEAIKYLDVQETLIDNEILSDYISADTLETLNDGLQTIHDAWKPMYDNVMTIQSAYKSN